MKKLTIISSILLILIIMFSACSQESTISVEEEINGDLQKTAEQEKFKEDVKTMVAGTAAALANIPEPTSSQPDSTSSAPAARSGPSITADWMKNDPEVDGDLSGWDPPIQRVITHVVYGEDKWNGKLDSSGTVLAGWNDTYLYLGIRVKDDKYVQEATKEQIFLGDSVEILFDRDVSGDYYLHSMNDDDYQIGFSPGRYGIVSCYITNGKVASNAFTDCTPEDPEAYVWFPKTEAGSTTKIKIGVLESSEGYQVELRIPWSLLGVTNPSEGDHYGFAISISDNDEADTKKQQTMTSNVETRIYNDPTTWGDLYLQKK